MEKLFKTKEFWVALIGGLIAIIGYFVGKYAPQYAEDVKFIISVVEPIVAIILGSVFIAGRVEKLGADIRLLALKK